MGVAIHRGTHASADGHTFGPYKALRIEVLADLPHLRLTHSVIYDGDPGAATSSAPPSCWSPPGSASTSSLGFGGDQGREVRLRAAAGRDGPPTSCCYAELYQDSATHWRRSAAGST